jgi:hypothetical protein
VGSILEDRPANKLTKEALWVDIAVHLSTLFSSLAPWYIHATSLLSE